MSLLTVLPPAGSSAEYGVDRCVRCTALNQSARCMGLLLYYNILGEAQALRQTVQLARDTARSDVTAAAYALAEDASSSLFRKLHLWKFILGKVGPSTLASLDDALQGLLGHGRAQLVLEDIAPTTFVPEPLVPVLTLAILMAAEALPRGGTVRLSGPPTSSYHLAMEGPQSAWPPSVLHAFTQAALPEDPAAREALAICLVAEAENIGVTASITGSDPMSAPAIHLVLPPALHMVEPQEPEGAAAGSALDPRGDGAIALSDLSECA